MVSEGGTATPSAPAPAPRASTASRVTLGIPDRTASVLCSNLTIGRCRMRSADPAPRPVPPANATALPLSEGPLTMATRPRCPCAGAPGALPLLPGSRLPGSSQQEFSQPLQISAQLSSGLRVTALPSGEDPLPQGTPSPHPGTFCRIDPLLTASAP